LHDRVEEIVRTMFNDDRIELTDETTAADIPGWDSLANVNLMFAIEQEFDVRFDDDEFGGFANIGELKERLAAKAA
jgi:acyl carrier protein